MLSRVHGPTCTPMHYTLLDRAHQADLRTDLHFAETSSRPTKATLKNVKIDIFRHFQPTKATRIKKERLKML